MICFHSFLFLDAFLPDPAMATLANRRELAIVGLGFLPVDGFLLLTGLLIAAPMFREEKKKTKQAKEEGEKKNIATGTNGGAADPTTAGSSPSSSSSSVWRFDLATCYYRRVTRMLPSYWLALTLYCGALFPHGYEYSLSLLRSEGLASFYSRVLPGATEAPNHCNVGHLATNALFANHLMPFGGCMGWTWSLALQWNFYLFFPALWWVLHRRAARQADERAKDPANASSKKPMKTPSQMLVPWLVAFLVLSLFVRVLGALHMRTFDLRHEEGLFLSFFYYSNTLTRGAAIVQGVLLAWVGVYRPNWVARAQRWPGWLTSLAWLASGAVLAAQLWWVDWFKPGVIAAATSLPNGGGAADPFEAVDTPGNTVLRFTQLLGGPESMLQLATSNIPAYWPHLLFHVLALVGSPLSSLMFGWLVFAVLYRVGSLGTWLSRVLSAPAWFPLATLSYWMYLLHPAIMTTCYSRFVEHFGDLPATLHVHLQSLEGGIPFAGLATVYANAALQIVLAAAAALVLHVFFEQPLEVLLRRSEAVKAVITEASVSPTAASSSSSKSATASSAVTGSGSSWFFRAFRGLCMVYCCICMVYLVLHHLAIYVGVSLLKPQALLGA
jgi:peptidoglycan/LPS O-acetylase OafA/YrhL